MKKTYNVLALLVFLFIIFYFPIATKIAPPKEVSKFENRDLAHVPKYSKESLLDGTYLPQWEEYFSDQIIHRDEMIWAYTYTNANIFNKVVVNDTVITNKSLLPYLEVREFSKDEIEQSANSICEKLLNLKSACDAVNAEFVYVGIPEQRSMLREDYPDYLENENEYLNTVEEVFFSNLNKNGISYVNMRDVFKNENYRSYYSVTDHHYNIFGAFRTYTAIMDKLEESGNSNGKMNVDEFNLVELKNDFYGSRARMIYKAYPLPDYLSYYEPRTPINFDRWDSGVQINRIFFAPGDVNEDITYNVYMGGDNAETLIHTYRPELPKILVIGDSFTNPLETLLYTSFDSMLSLDFRANSSGKNVYDYINEFQPDVVLLIKDDTQYISNNPNSDF